MCHEEGSEPGVFSGALKGTREALLAFNGGCLFWRACLESTSCTFGLWLFFASEFWGSLFMDLFLTLLCLDDGTRVLCL